LPHFFRSRTLDAALLVAAALFSFVTVATFALAPKQDSEGIAVVFAPWTDAGQTFGLAVGAGGRFIRYGAFEFIAVVEPETASYGARVRANGAWLIADPKALAACLDALANRRRS
jgi:hypothetical protein